MMKKRKLLTLMALGLAAGPTTAAAQSFQEEMALDLAQVGDR